MMRDDATHPAWIEINLRQFQKNIAIVKNFLGPTRLCMAVKANAYGHGIVEIAKTAVLSGIDYLGVAHAQEGVKLRKAGIEIPILVLGAIHERQIKDLLNYHLEFSVSSKYKAELVQKVLGTTKQACKVHIEIETGMQRTGIRAESLLSVSEHLENLGCFDIVGVYSHLAITETPSHPETQRQIALFKAVTDELAHTGRNFIRHISNSGGLCHYPEANFDMVRPGILLLGYFQQQPIAALAGIEPFLSIKAHLAYFKVVAANQGISYGHSYKTKQQTRIVTIPVGYGDGYRRALSNVGRVLIRGKSHRIAGTVCMDQFMVDIGRSEAYVGDEVVLIGRQGDEEISVNEIAELCDTISYEILCGFNERMPRRYFK